MTPTTTAAPRLTEDGAAAFRLLLASAHPDDLAEADVLGLIDLLGRKLSAMREGRDA